MKPYSVVQKLLEKTAEWMDAVESATGSVKLSNIHPLMFPTSFIIITSAVAFSDTPLVPSAAILMALAACRDLRILKLPIPILIFTIIAQTPRILLEQSQATVYHAFKLAFRTYASMTVMLALTMMFGIGRILGGLSYIAGEKFSLAVSTLFRMIPAQLRWMRNIVLAQQSRLLYRPGYTGVWSSAARGAAILISRSLGRSAALASAYRSRVWAQKHEKYSLKASLLLLTASMVIVLCVWGL